MFERCNKTPEGDTFGRSGSAVTTASGKMAGGGGGGNEELAALDADGSNISCRVIMCWSGGRVEGGHEACCSSRVERQNGQP